MLRWFAFFLTVLLALLLDAGATRAQRDTERDRDHDGRDVPRDEQPPRPATVNGSLPARERTRLLAELSKLDNQYKLASARRDLDAARNLLERCLEVRQKIYSEAEYPRGHPNVAANLHNLGVVCRQVRRYEEARSYFERAAATYRTLYPNGHDRRGETLYHLGNLHADMGRLAEAASTFKEGLVVTRHLYPAARFPDGHANVAASLSNLGTMLHAMGRYDEAQTYYRQALAMCRILFPPGKYPDGHPYMALALTNMGVLFDTTGRTAEARRYHEQALALRRKLYPAERYRDGHPELAFSLNCLGVVAHLEGRYDEARAYHEQASAMYRKCYPQSRYPDGHRMLAVGMNNQVALLLTMGEYAKALPLNAEVLAMREKLYPAVRFPKGHPDVASSLINQANLLHLTARVAEARPLAERGLAMYQKLFPADQYPDGHPLLAQGLHNLGALFEAMRQYEKARDCFARGLAMNEKLYPPQRFPDGHLHLVRSLDNLGDILETIGQFDEARRCHARALTLLGRLAGRHALIGAEAEALAFFQSLPRARDGYLSASRAAPEPMPNAYSHLWRTRALLTRVLEQRHQATRIALKGDAATRRTWAELLQTRDRLARLTLNPGPDPAARDRELDRLDGRKIELERALTDLLPELSQARAADALGPMDLARRLPHGAIFVDLYRYDDYRKGRLTPRYVAFTVRSDGTVARVELGEAGPIDAAVRTWRSAIVKGADTTADATVVADLVWAPLSKVLPKGTSTVYLAPDGELARLPWCALPGREKGRVLLEDFILAVIPHGPFLLNQLRASPRASTDKEVVLALGGIDYGPRGDWVALPGTSAELRQIAFLAGLRAVVTLDGGRATWAALKERLPTAHYAHLATHGFIDQKALGDARRQRDEFLKKQKYAMHDGRLTRGGMPSPLAFTGLALAGANDPKGDGLVTGEALVGLPLDHLYLCVLSACESGLGDLGPVAGEPAQGLPRALHLAGCRNVISSLWNVNDKATAALMARFYHELWVAKRPPLEALRQAQLTILRHPGRIDDLADRGRPDFAKTVRLPADSATSGRRAATRLWAAFVLSGTGR